MDERVVLCSHSRDGYMYDNADSPNDSKAVSHVLLLLLLLLLLQLLAGMHQISAERPQHRSLTYVATCFLYVFVRSNRTADQTAGVREARAIYICMPRIPR